MDELIECMKKNGWSETKRGNIQHNEWLVMYPTWAEAIKACIEVASEG